MVGDGKLVLLPCAINAACAALVDAGIPLKHLAVAICCCLAESGYIILDPNKLEEQSKVKKLVSSLHRRAAVSPWPPAGPLIFQLFLHAGFSSTKTIETFQNQANNTEEGITLFVPKDDAFSSLKKSTLSNLTQDQLKSLCLFHALSHYYSLSDFKKKKKKKKKNLSETSPISTFAGGQYSLNFTDVSGTVHIGSGWPNTKVSSSVYSPDPIAIYQVDKVLLPEAIFGTDIPPTPAPAPAPDIDPAARIVPTVHTNSFRLTIIQPRSTYFFFFCSPGPNNQLCGVSSSSLDSAALSNSSPQLPLHTALL
ncbi:hypothetical protein HYC85_023125 [Camellia sinensis]|uniref:FAS1 domain-containing protein n=1 Tax=Camellia sinensis TaxID=4442 RepID=A0A7J7GHK9_CAMSI|nr:hypothetical protein HYC85_023125 [Camellia sinensis]